MAPVPALPYSPRVTHPSMDSGFVRACRGLPVTHTPIWLMRQAGRYMKEYRELRARVSFLELCRTPELVAETTVFAQETIGADAAIVFSDLLVVLEAMGQDLHYPKGGPKLGPPVRTGADVDALRIPEPEALSYVWDGVAATRDALKPDVPLIGFCGAPFTLAAYAIEAGGSRNFRYAKTLMYSDTGAWNELCRKIVETLVPYLVGQARAGAQVVQVFDSWVGAVGPDDYARYVAPHSAELIRRFKEQCPDTPLIHFGTGTAPLLEQVQAAGGDVVGVDFHTDFAQARQRLGDDQPVMGNLDPILLYAPVDVLLKRAQAVLDANAGRDGHVFNLGHGITPPTPISAVETLVETVQGFSK